MTEPTFRAAVTGGAARAYHALTMDWSALEGEQVEQMLAVIMRQRDYLARLVERMRIRKFPPDDPLYRAVLAAQEKASNLCVVLAKCRPAMDADVMQRKPWGG